MRKLILTFAFAIVAAVPLRADNGRSQSYFTWDDGGTVVRQGEDGKEVDARVNFPLFQGDEVLTSRRGRSEIRLSDGNIIALDRSTDVLFHSILNSYDGGDDNAQTVAELRYGHVILQRTGSGHDQVRLDTENASYVASNEAIYSIDAEGRGAEHITVFNGDVEVRTPERTTTLRAGESVSVDHSGVYDQVSEARADDFERWFLQRSQRYNDRSSRYLDSSLSYADPDLDSNGSWVYASSYGSWCWRPYVGAGWRPYFNGSWIYGRGGHLIWVSYEPWGWVPYHYGRWGYDATWGWLWFPGISYAPAWVYWMYGPGYVGWIPMGWYDCYRPYYAWAYQPYARFGFGFNYGWFGRVRVGDIDLRPWTFMRPGEFIGTRPDRAALTLDQVRDHLAHANGGLATVSGAPAPFRRGQDPSAAVAGMLKRGVAPGSVGGATDVTPFFRRDPNLSPAVRAGVLGSRIPNPLSGGGVPSGVPTPGTPGTLEGRVNRGEGVRRDAPQTPAGMVERGTPARGGWRQDVPFSTLPLPQAERGTPPRDSTWRDRGNHGSSQPPAQPRQYAPPQTQITPQPPASQNNDWRGRDRSVRTTPQPQPQPYRYGNPPQRNTVERGSDVPRRVIDGIGGARIYGEGNQGRSSTPPPSRSSSPPPTRSYGGSSGSGGGGGSHGSSSGGGSHSSSSSGGSSHSSSSSGSSSSKQH